MDHGDGAPARGSSRTRRRYPSKIGLAAQAKTKNRLKGDYAGTGRLEELGRFPRVCLLAP